MWIKCVTHLERYCFSIIGLSTIWVICSCVTQVCHSPWEILFLHNWSVNYMMSYFLKCVTHLERYCFSIIGLSTIWWVIFSCVAHVCHLPREILFLHYWSVNYMMSYFLKCVTHLERYCFSIIGLSTIWWVIFSCVAHVCHLPREVLFLHYWSVNYMMSYFLICFWVAGTNCYRLMPWNFTTKRPIRFTNKNSQQHFFSLNLKV